MLFFVTVAHELGKKLRAGTIVQSSGVATRSSRPRSFRIICINLLTMRIKVINPNTNVSMTEKIGAAAVAVASPGTEIVACNPVSGPTAIEGHYDEAMSVVGVLEEISKGEAAGIDGYVIACFGDPGLLAARELAKGPVLGIAEAAMHAASFISTGFSIVTTLERTRVIAQHLVDNYGMTRFCHKVRAIDLPVLSLETPHAKTAILQECRLALEEDHCGRSYLVVVAWLIYQLS